MRWIALAISTLFVAACQSANWPLVPLTEGEHYFVSSTFNADEATIVLSVEAGAQPICVNPADWPLQGGKFPSPDPLTVHRGDQVFTLEEVYVDADMGVTVKIDPHNVLTASVPLGSFDGVGEWTGHEEIVYQPRVSTCY